MRLLSVVLTFAALVFLATAAQAGQTIKLGIVTTPGSAQYIVAEKFKELVEARSDHAVDIFHSASLGNETEILQQIQMNAVQMGVITLGPFDAFVPETKVVNFPFLFKSYEQVSEVLDGPLGAEILTAVEKAGFKGLAFSENGFRHLTNNVRAVDTVEDVDGLKIRVMESAMHKELWRVLGANPTPMGWPIYTELQQDTIDGQENPLSVIWVFNLYEVQDHLSLTGHVYSAHIDVANLAWFNALPEADRELLKSAMYEAALHQRKWNRDNEADFLAKLKDKGMQVVENPDKDSFRAKAVELKNMDIFAGHPDTAALLEKFLAATK
jgi:tripartite ATP-independent transporter DctP family solute receptor